MNRAAVCGHESSRPEALIGLRGFFVPYTTPIDET